MTLLPSSLSRLLPLCALLLGAVAGPVQAEKADRLKKMEVESDLPGKVDLANQIVVFNGNVVVTKGTMVIRADRIEVRESPEGYQYATASGSGKLAFFRTKRDNVNEFVEGEAERLEYDGKADTVRFINRASVKRLRGTAVADEVTGALITYDNTAELFTVAGGSSAATPTNPTGRVRAVFTPREGTPAAAEAASAASAAATGNPR
ncbi:MAG TPA: lipopolysaccharide transport periplasmic protein LptA [Rhizobacter sp.]|nr:lipopolysaccharide transport periplasmic protein LptA [Rhizobacter sp.]